MKLLTQSSCSSLNTIPETDWSNLTDGSLDIPRFAMYDLQQSSSIAVYRVSPSSTEKGLGIEANKICGASRYPSYFVSPKKAQDDLIIDYRSCHRLDLDAADHGCSSCTYRKEYNFSTGLILTAECFARELFCKRCA
jgi:hypothetical protein